MYCWRMVPLKKQACPDKNSNSTPPTANIAKRIKRLWPMLTASKNFSAKLGDFFVLWIVQISCLQAYSLVDITKPRNRTTIYVSYIDMYKWKRNWALSVIAYKICQSYHVDQSFSLSGVTSFVERRLPQWEIDQKPQETLDKHFARLLVKKLTGTHCVCLLRFAVSDQARSFSIGKALSKTVKWVLKTRTAACARTTTRSVLRSRRVLHTT